MERRRPRTAARIRLNMDREHLRSPAVGQQPVRAGDERVGAVQVDGGPRARPVWRLRRDVWRLGRLLRPRRPPRGIAPTATYRLGGGAGAEPAQRRPQRHNDVRTPLCPKGCPSGTQAHPHAAVRTRILVHLPHRIVLLQSEREHDPDCAPVQHYDSIGDALRPYCLFNNLPLPSAGTAATPALPIPSHPASCVLSGDRLCCTAQRGQAQAQRMARGPVGPSTKGDMDGGGAARRPRACP